jgi:hypothetical protein
MCEACCEMAKREVIHWRWIAEDGRRRARRFSGFTRWIILKRAEQAERFMASAELLFAIAVWTPWAR